MSQEIDQLQNKINALSNAFQILKRVSEGCLGCTCCSYVYEFSRNTLERLEDK